VLAAVPESADAAACSVLLATSGKLRGLASIFVYVTLGSPEQTLMNLEGLGAAILGGGEDADAVANMHGLSR
jgi:hypothetical protein